MLYLEPIVTEVQFNFVEDKEDINTRKAVCRVRINGDTAWIDHLQGEGFFEFLSEQANVFAFALTQYKVKFIEANVSGAVLKVLKKIFGKELILIDDRPSNLCDKSMHHIKIIINV
jgi:hypothetical protein